MTVEKCCIADWKVLASFHYRSHRVPVPRSFFCLRRGEELCGVIVYSYGPPACFGRKLVLPREIRLDMKRLNENLSIINRIVVHPKYRSIGLGSLLIRKTLPLAPTRYVELVAVMARYNPFAEKGGMRKIAVQEPTKSVKKIAVVLKELGFDLQLLGSRKYVLSNLKNLSKGDLDRVREIFIMNPCPRLRKIFSSDLPYGTNKVYREGIVKAGFEGLAHLIRVCGLLLQLKVYLFWDQYHKIREHT